MRRIALQNNLRPLKRTASLPTWELIDRLEGLLLLSHADRYLF